MKLITLILAGSVGANAAMLGAFALRPAIAPAAIRDLFVDDEARAAEIAGENRAQRVRAAAQARAAA
jgi:hypothetical protein